METTTRLFRIAWDVLFLTRPVPQRSSTLLPAQVTTMFTRQQARDIAKGWTGSLGYFIRKGYNENRHSPYWSRGINIRNTKYRHNSRKDAATRHQDEYGKYRRPCCKRWEDTSVDETDRCRSCHGRLHIRILSDTRTSGDAWVSCRSDKQPPRSSDLRWRYYFFQRTWRCYQQSL